MTTLKDLLAHSTPASHRNEPGAGETLEVNAWYAFLTIQYDAARGEEYERADGIYQYLGDGVWGDEHEALDSTPDYDRLVKQ